MSGDSENNVDGVTKCHGAFIEVYKRTAKYNTVLR